MRSTNISTGGRGMPNHTLTHDLLLAWLAPVAVAGLLSACGGGDRAPADGAGTPSGGAPATPPPAAETTSAGGAEGTDTAPSPAGTGGGAAGGGAGDASAKLVALGDSIFHGQAGGGTCYACHGQDGKGSGVGPDLTDGEWLNTDGSLEGIVKTIRTGVPTPKKAPAPMPPMGGAALTPDQIRAVASYVHSLSKGGGKG